MKDTTKPTETETLLADEKQTVTKKTPNEKKAAVKRLTPEEEKHLFGNKKPKKEKPLEKITEKKVDQLEHQDISKKGLKSQKQFIVDKLDDVIENPSKYTSEEYIDLSVPGDGSFKIKNNIKAIDQFKKQVQKKWPDKPYKPYKSKKLPDYPESAYKDYELKVMKERDDYLKS